MYARTLSLQSKVVVGSKSSPLAKWQDISAKLPRAMERYSLQPFESAFCQKRQQYSVNEGVLGHLRDLGAEACADLRVFLEYKPVQLILNCDLSR